MLRTGQDYRESIRDGRQVWVTFKSRAAITQAALCYTKDRGKWIERKWESMDAVVDTKAGRATATLPEGTSVYFMNLQDDRSCVVSSEHEEVN